MSRCTYVIRNGEMVDKSTLYEDDTSDAPHIIRDGMEMTRHMANGKYYDSKRAFRAATKAAGCIEVGDQANYGRRREVPRLDKRERVEHIKQSIHELRNGRRA